jgi:hypothetical protein
MHAMYTTISDLYPVMIRQARYSGVYEGGQWIAIGNYEDVELDDYFYGDDSSAIDLFESEAGQLIGVGNTPNEALDDMLSKYREKTVID